LRREVAPFGVQVVVVEPGAVRTEMAELVRRVLAPNAPWRTEDVARAEGEAADVEPAKATAADPTGVEPPPAPTPTEEQEVQPEAAKPRRPRPKYRAWADDERTRGEGAPRRRFLH